MKLMPMIIHSLVLFAGIAGLYVAWLQFQKTQALISGGITSVATVVENVPEIIKGNTSYKPKFTYMDENHNPKQFIGDVSTSPPAWSIGETTLVIFLPQQPGSVRIISYWNLYRVTILVTAAAAPFLVIGLGYFLYFFYSRSLVSHLN